MITETAYKTYFGVSTAPTNLTRLEFLALEEIKSIMETFKGYTLLTGTKKEKRKCVCNPNEGGDGICKCD